MLMMTTPTTCLSARKSKRKKKLSGSAEHYTDENSSSEDLHQEPDYTAGVDELYNSPRALDGDRTRYIFDSNGGSGRRCGSGSSVRPSLEDGARHRSTEAPAAAEPVDAWRRGTGRRQQQQQ
jgi:hypothetical protein